MGKIISLDSLKNFVANLGTGRDKASSATYQPPTATDQDLLNAYRGSWLPRKIVDIPASDATRRWRAWQADKQQISLIEAEEKRIGIKQKLPELLVKARLFGGAGIYISIKGEKNPNLPLNPESVQRGGIDFIVVLPKRVLSVTEIENDPASPRYGKPKMYRISSTVGIQDIHPSRIVAMSGADHPDPELSENVGWGDSVLTPAFESCRNTDATMANIASLVYEAKVDVLGIPGLSDIMQDPKDREALVTRVQLAAMLKGNNGTLIRDAEETYDSKSMSFSGLEAIANLFFMVSSGAADIPITRLFGQSPGGLNSTGEADLRNYYDHIQSMQEITITPEMAILDECIIRSALGSRPPEIFYTWNSLWQTTDTERASNGKVYADTIKTLSDTKLFPEDALSAAAENLLIERSVLPGLEGAMNDYREADDVL